KDGDEALDTEHKRLDPTKKIDLKVYSSFNGDDDWVKHVRELETNSPLVVFSKSYCPYSRRAKSLIQTYALDPPPKIVEVDLREDGDLLKVILTRLTKHSTFPNIILRGRSLGGADDLQALHDGGKLEELFEDNRLTVHGPR
ncbi:thioredoxin-like protein, partial [Thelephora ganbajun]